MEIEPEISAKTINKGRSSHEERGLKLHVLDDGLGIPRRSSHEERGLK